MSKMSPQMRLATQRRDLELARTLQKPKRKRLEDCFEQEHCHDSDEELMDYVLSCFLEHGATMQRMGFVGVRYLEKRLGRWNSFMPKVKRRARELERKGQMLNTAMRPGLSEEPKSDSCGERMSALL